MARTGKATSLRLQDPGTPPRIAVCTAISYRHAGSQGIQYLLRRGLAQHDVPLAIAWVPSLYVRSERANQTPCFSNSTGRAFTSSRTKQQKCASRLSGPGGRNPTAARKRRFHQPLSPYVASDRSTAVDVSSRDRSARNNESHRDSAISLVFNLLCPPKVNQQHLDLF